MAALLVRSRRYGRLVVAGALAAASLALPACGGSGSGAPATPASPGGNVDPAAQSGVGGVINKAKDTAGNVEQHDATLSTAATQP
jgi:hypothetical protein